jgi:C1A family cysteine protease
MRKAPYRLKPDKKDERDLLKSSAPRPKSSVPLTVDLRPNDAEDIFDQLTLGSCTANAISAWLSYKNKQDRNMFYHYSRLWLYWQERNLEGTVNEDSGAYIRDGFKVLQKIGCATESYFPYTSNPVAVFTHTPSPESYDNAQYHKIDEYYRIMTKAQLREELAHGNPVVMGIQVYESFETAEVARTGIVPMPDTSKEEFLGGHAILAMGYKFIGNKEYIICRNSWGKGWGDNGYFYLPMDFIGWYVSDMWSGN